MKKNSKGPANKTVPANHWEMNYKQWESSKTMKKLGGSDFDPKCPSDRSTTHLKINKEDH